MPIPPTEDLSDDQLERVREAFLSRILEIDGHWIWNGHLAQGKRKDYPRFYFRRKGFIPEYDASARKVALELFADGADGKQASVVCDENKCVHPDHIVAHSEYGGFDPSEHEVKT